jgi:hypothetical protein
VKDIHKLFYVLFLSGLLLQQVGKATFIPLTVQEFDGSPSVTKVKNITFNGATLTDLLNGRVLVTVSSTGGASVSGTAGSIQFSDGTTFASDNSNLFWNDANNRLGIGTSTLGQAKTRINIASAAEQGLVLKAIAGQTGNLLEVQNGRGLLIHNLGLSSDALVLRNPHDVTRTLRFNINNNLWTIAAQSGFQITSSSAASLYMGGGGEGSMIGKWSFSSASTDTGLVFNPSSRAQFAASGLSGANATTYTSDAYPGAGRLFANKWTHYTGRGASLSGNNSGNGGEMIFDFGRGANATTGTAGKHGKMILQVDTGVATGLMGNILEVKNNSGVVSLAVHSNGSLGVGLDNPVRKLHISEAMRIQPQSSSPSSPALGDLYVDSDTNELCFYDGSSWTGLKAGAACL